MAFISHDDTYTVGLAYNADLFEHSTAQNFLSSYMCLLEAALAAPTTLVCKLPLMDRKQLTHIMIKCATGRGSSNCSLYVRSTLQANWMIDVCGTEGHWQRYLYYVALHVVVVTALRVSTLCLQGE